MAGSDQITLSRLAVPAMTSTSPGAAFGASPWLSEGLRKSQSTRITRAPPSALSCAKDAAIVDFPSLGSADVIPITLLDLAAPLRSILTFMARINSAKEESGKSTTYRSKLGFGAIILETTRSVAALTLTGAALAPALIIGTWVDGTKARHSASRADCICRFVRNTRSSSSRSNARPTPHPIPPNRARASTRNVLGRLFSSGLVAGDINRASVIGNDCC